VGFWSNILTKNKNEKFQKCTLVKKSGLLVKYFGKSGQRFSQYLCGFASFLPTFPLLNPY